MKVFRKTRLISNQNKHWHECCSHRGYLAWATAWLWVRRIQGVQLNIIWFCRIMNYKFGLLPGLASLLTDWALISGSVRCAPYYCARSFERPDVAHVLPVDLLSSNLKEKKQTKTTTTKKPR